MELPDPGAKLPIIYIEDCEEVTNHKIEITGKLPKPSYRTTSNKYHTKRRKIQRGYYFYQEPTPETLMDQVEYDLDEEDSQWLFKFNSKHFKKFSNCKISEDNFEKVMDRLEKYSIFETKHSGANIPDIDEDAVCAICFDGEGSNTNAILFCDMCNLAVHQECYGVPYVPEGQWLCRRCLQSPSKNVECCLCPNKGGAFKQTDDNRWAHVICALWIPEVCFANTVFLEPIDNLQKIPQARWNLNCYICKQKKVGACIQCHKTNCYVPFHVTCAQQAGLYMKIQPFEYYTADGEMSDVKKVAYCDAHGPRDANNASGMYSSRSSSEEDEDIDDRRAKMKKTRKILSERRNSALNPVYYPIINEEHIKMIGNVLKIKKKLANFEELKKLFMVEIVKYWQEKRRKRNGVPLIRRLQVSYNKNIVKPCMDVDNDEKSRIIAIRYDLEKARLLVGEVKKREIKKAQLLEVTRKVIEKQIEHLEGKHIDED